MTQEDKELLLKDLCARLLYGVICSINGEDVDIGFGGITGDLFHKTAGAGFSIYKDEVKPYLRPMSSMTEEEFLEYHNIKYNKVTYKNKWKRIDVGKFHNIGIIPIEEYLDWLNEHHFDYRGLIEKGLALEAPDGMYKIV